MGNKEMYMSMMERALDRACRYEDNSFERGYSQQWWRAFADEQLRAALELEEMADRLWA